MESTHSDEQFRSGLCRSNGGMQLSENSVNKETKEEEMKSIFAFIDAFKPDSIPLDYRLQPFIPDYIPSIGDIDPIIQVLKD